MKNFVFVLFFMAFQMGAIFSQNPIQQSIFFDTNKANLSPEAEKTLLGIVEKLRLAGRYQIQLTGSTDTDGSSQSNQILAERRIQTVRQYLENKGIGTANFLVKAIGETDPTADNQTAEGKKKSRRVDIFVNFLPPPVLAGSTPFEKGKTHHIMRLYQQLGTKIQNFKVNTSRDTVLIGAKGTQLVIPKGAFSGVGTNAVVDFKLKECYDFSDMIGENLTTTDGEKLLRTGGMIYTEATENGKLLTLNRPIGVTFSSNESKEAGMQLFAGTRDAQRNGAVNWTPVPNSTIPAQNSERRNAETVLESTIYAHEGYLFVPYLVLDETNKRPLTLREICDLTDCPTLTNDLKTISTTINGTTVNRNISNSCAALLLYIDDHPADRTLTPDQIHRKAFDEIYTLYGVNTLEELKKQPSKSWDSLMTVRKNRIIAYESAAKKRQTADSLTQIAMAKERLFNKELKKMEAQFSMPQLGWFNCDKYTTNQMVTIQTETPFSTSSNVHFILKRQKSLLAAGASSNKVGENLKAYVPAGEEILVVGMKIEDGQTYLALHEVKGVNMNLKLNFVALSPHEIKEKLKVLN